MPQATSNGFKKMKPIELIVHDFQLSPAGHESISELGIKSVQVGAMLGGEKATLEMNPAFPLISSSAKSLASLWNFGLGS